MRTFKDSSQRDWLQTSRLEGFIHKMGFTTYDELLQYSQQNTEEFWKASLKETGLVFSKPYSKLLSEGLPFPRWAEGAELSIVENCIDRHAKASPHKTALIFEADSPGQAHKWSFEDLARASSFIAAELQASGAKPGDRAALLMPMSLEMMASFFGILRAGLTVVPIFSGYGADAIRDRLQDAAIKFVFVQEKNFRKAKEIPVKATLQSLLKDCPSVRKVFSLNREDFHSGPALRHEILPSVPMKAEQECLLLYTSGTTGKPKACVHTPFGVLATTGKELLFGFDLRAEDKFFWYTDIGWMMGPWEILGVLQLGASVVLYEGVPDYPAADRLWKILEEHQVTQLGISPTAIRVLKKSGPELTRNFSFKNLRILGSTGEPWDDESWLWYFEEVGKSRCPIQNISGGTEIMGCHLMPSLYANQKPSTLGGPSLGVRAEVWTEEGTKLDRGLGHLVCLSPFPSMTKGFLGSKEKYLEAYFSKFGEKVWYHGDWALIDEDGLWFLRGRSDDTIKIAGKRVGPNEFESALMQDSRVAEAAAVGIPHPIKGECVYCYVVLKKTEDQTAEVRAELTKAVATTMGKALSPEKILFVEALPKTRSGKILRGLIRKVVLKEKFDDSAAENLQSLKAIETAR